jgi:hypothetical protein
MVGESMNSIRNIEYMLGKNTPVNDWHTSRDHPRIYLKLNLGNLGSLAYNSNPRDLKQILSNSRIRNQLVSFKCSEALICTQLNAWSSRHELAF